MKKRHLGLTGTGLGHRCHWCPGHRRSIYHSVTGADSRLCSLPTLQNSLQRSFNKTRQEKHHARDFCAWTLRQPAAVASPGELTSTVFWDPAHVRMQTVDVEMLSIKVSTLFISEVSLCLGHGSVLQDLNFILRPIQYLPPFLGLMKGKEHTGCIILCFSSVL